MRFLCGERARKRKLVTGFNRVHAEVVLLVCVSVCMGTFQLYVWLCNPAQPYVAIWCGNVWNLTSLQCFMDILWYILSIYIFTILHYPPLHYSPQYPNYKCSLTAKAACSHVVELAQAEVAHNPRACPKVREFSAIRLADAEVAVHKFFQRYGLSVPIQVYNAEIAGTKTFPYLKLSDWVLFLWNTGRFARQLVGCSLEQMQAVLTEYWRRFRALFPHHEIFGLEGIDLAHTVPYYSHTDEGRSQKHEPIWILSCHGALGRGTRRFVTEKKHTKPISENEMGLNFLGQTFSTQFLICTITKQVSNMHPEAISQLLNLFATDAAMLACEGILCDGIRLRLVHIGTKGDLPALGKVGGFTRSFLRPSTRNPCEGICHLCLAGQEENTRTGAEHFPYEDFRPRPCWEQTMHTVLPWGTEPDMLSGLPINREEASGFFCLDLWHIFHLGICKHFVANSLVMIAESDLLPRSSMENKFKSMTDEYVTFCRTNSLAMWITEISRDTLLFPQGSVAPVGKWNKGSCSTTMMLFLEHYCTKFIKGKSDDEQLLLIVSWPPTYCLYFWRYFIIFKMSFQICKIAMHFGVVQSGWKNCFWLMLCSQISMGPRLCVRQMALRLWIVHCQRCTVAGTGWTRIAQSPFPGNCFSSCMSMGVWHMRLWLLARIGIA